MAFDPRRSRGRGDEPVPLPPDRGSRNFVPAPTPAASPLINWPQNDYWLGPVVGVDEATAAAHLARGKQLSLSLLYWMQTGAASGRRYGMEGPSASGTWRERQTDWPRRCMSANPGDSCGVHGPGAACQHRGADAGDGAFQGGGDGRDFSDSVGVAPIGLTSTRRVRG